MTLKQMRQAAFRRLGSSAYLNGGTDPGAVDSTELDAEINLAAQDVALKLHRAKAGLRPKVQDFDSVIDQQEYSFHGSSGIVDNDDFLGLELLELLVTSGDPTTYVNCDLVDAGALQRKNYRRSWFGTNDESPDIYLRGQNFGFVNVPSSVRNFRLHYVARPATLIVGEENDEKLVDYISVEYHEVVVQTAVVEIYAAEASPMTETARAKLHGLVEQLFATANSRQRMKVHYKQSRRQ